MTTVSRPDLPPRRLGGSPLRGSSGLSPDSSYSYECKEQPSDYTHGAAKLVNNKIFTVGRDIIFAMLTAEKSIHQFVQDQATILKTPYYLIDESRLIANLSKIARVRQRSVAKSVLALKCF